MMSKRVGSITLILTLLSLVIPSQVNAAVKVGGNCAKVGLTAKAAGKNLTCTKSNGKLQWKAAAGATSFQFSSYCQADPLVPNEWAEYQKNITNYQCIPPYRYVKQSLTTQQPKIVQSSKADLLPVTQCKLARGEGWNYYLNKGLLLNPKLVVQIVPFATKDFPSTSDPRADWKLYVDYLTSSLTNMTDVPSNYQFRIAPKYYATQTNLVDYKLSGDVSHGEAAANPSRFKLISDVLAVADPEIDFTGADYVFFFSPLTVSRDVLGNHIAWGGKTVTREKTFEGNSYITSYINDFKSKNWIPREPFSFIHEMMHVFNSAEDYYGDVNYGGSDVGTGNWGNMSGANMEHLIWDKWNVQMISDDQFLEWAEFAGNRYGTPQQQVEDALRQGKNVLLEIEIAGAKQVKAHLPQSVLVFLEPPTWEELVSRLEGRGTDGEQRRAERLELAQEELAAAAFFDVVLVNDQVESVVRKLIELAQN